MSQNLSSAAVVIGSLRVRLKSKYEGKGQEEIQSSTTPDRDHISESDKNTRKHHTRELQEARPFPAGDHKAAINRQASIIKTNVKHKLQNGINKRSTALERSLKIYPRA